ncbi:hypothetical protein GCM10009609_06360 [Pseudonocardia aurantiaca]
MLGRVIDSRPEIPDVPDISAEWYMRIVDAATRLPHAAQVAAVFATDAVIVCYLAAFLVIWWNARTRPAADPLGAHAAAGRRPHQGGRPDRPRA